MLVAKRLATAQRQFHAVMARLVLVIVALHQPNLILRQFVHHSSTTRRDHEASASPAVRSASVQA